MSSYMAKDVLCPYYLKEEGVKIHCEGVEEKSYIHLVFASANIRRDYQLDKCCNNYNKCLIAAMNNRKWDEK